MTVRSMVLYPLRVAWQPQAASHLQRLEPLSSDRLIMQAFITDSQLTESATLALEISCLASPVSYGNTNRGEP